MTIRLTFCAFAGAILFGWAALSCALTLRTRVRRPSLVPQSRWRKATTRRAIRQCFTPRLGSKKWTLLN